MEIEDFSALFRDSAFTVFRGIVASKGVVRGFVIPGGGSYSRSQLDDLVDQAKQLGASGLVWVRFPDGAPQCSVKAIEDGIVRGRSPRRRPRLRTCWCSRRARPSPRPNCWARCG